MRRENACSDACCPKPCGVPSKLDPWSVPGLRPEWEPDCPPEGRRAGISKSGHGPKSVSARRTLVTRQERSRFWESVERKRRREVPHPIPHPGPLPLSVASGVGLAIACQPCALSRRSAPGTNDTFLGVRGPSGGFHCWGRRGGLPHRHQIRSQGFSPSQRFNPPAGSRIYFTPHPPLGFHGVFRALVRLPSRRASSARACSLDVGPLPCAGPVRDGFGCSTE